MRPIAKWPHSQALLWLCCKMPAYACRIQHTRLPHTETMTAPTRQKVESPPQSRKHLQFGCCRDQGFKVLRCGVLIIAYLYGMHFLMRQCICHRFFKIVQGMRLVPSHSSLLGHEDVDLQNCCECTRIQLHDNTCACSAPAACQKHVLCQHHVDLSV
jgi:hypothetical protein